MPSRSLQAWGNTGRQALDEIEAAHRAVGGVGRGRRYATQQINQAYAVLLSSQFQRFCRDLHSEATDYLIRQPAFAPIERILQVLLIDGRRLDVGNPNPGNIGSDFGRFGMVFWTQVNALDRRNAERQKKLEELNAWRNAIAHQDFTDRRLRGRTTVGIADVRNWRRACEALAVAFDSVLRVYFTTLLGIPPW